MIIILYFVCYWSHNSASITNNANTQTTCKLTPKLISIVSASNVLALNVRMTVLSADICGSSTVA